MYSKSAVTKGPQWKFKSQLEIKSLACDKDSLYRPVVKV